MILNTANNEESTSTLTSNWSDNDIREMMEGLQEIHSEETVPQEESNEIVLSEEEQDLLQKTLEEVHKEIPENSKSVLIDTATSRFSSAIWYSEVQKKTIILAGLGGIGSYVGFMLSRMKPERLYIYDPDVVEEGNLSGQLYAKQDIGKLKTTALSYMMENYSEYYTVCSIPQRVDENTEGSDIMICGFDNMRARCDFFYAWKAYVASKPLEYRKNCLFIDGRLAAEEFQVFCMRGDDEYNIEKYKNNYLFLDSQADETICSYKQTTFMANMIGSIIVNLFVNFCANMCDPIIDRDLPFFTAYNAETMFFKTIS